MNYKLFQTKADHPLDEASKQKGFTLIELLVVIGVIGVLASGVMLALNPIAQIQKGRDAQRKGDLQKIKLLLEQYYNDNNRYPPALASDGSHNGNYTYSTYSGAGVWIGGLSSYATTLPKDPLNNLTTVFWDLGQYAYVYGNVSVPDGQRYDLVVQLESPQDPQRCQTHPYYITSAGNPSWCGLPLLGTGAIFLYDAAD